MTQVLHLASGAYFVESDNYRSAYDHNYKRIGESDAPLFLSPDLLITAIHNGCICSLRKQKEEAAAK